MNKPKLSIIVPVYNASTTIADCLDEMLLITEFQYEIILIDDGSTDDSAEICDKYALSNSNVIVHHQKNGGVSSARNIGIELSAGDILYFFDSDDLPCIDVLCYAVRIMEEQSVDMLISGYAVTDMNLFILKQYINEKEGSADPENVCIRFIRNQINSVMGSFLVKKTSLGEIRFPVGIRYGEDTTFIAECIANSKEVGVVNGILLLYRQNDSSVMHKLDLSRFDNYYSRKKLKEFVASEHREMRKLLFAIDSYYIPAVLEDDIRLLCHYGFSYRKIRHYLHENKIDMDIKVIISNSITDERIKSELSKWDNRPFVYYCSKRLNRLIYILRSSIGKAKRRLLNRLRLVL